MQLSDATFSRFAVWMKAQTGVHFPPGKKTLVHQRLTRRLAARNVATFEAYFRLLQDPAELDERETAIDLLTTRTKPFSFANPSISTGCSSTCAHTRHTVPCACGAGPRLPARRYGALPCCWPTCWASTATGR